MKAKITEEGVVINGIIISEELFDKEIVGFVLKMREVLIDDLINWIGEATTDREVMKTDLKYLISLDDEYVFSSINTNQYIAKSDNKKEFDNICKEILKLHKKNGGKQ